MDTKELTTKVWREALAENLADRAGFNQDQVSACLMKFDRAAYTHGPEVAFRNIHETYSSGLTSAAADSVSEKLEHALKDANTQTINTDPVTRIRQKIAKFKANIGKMDVQIGEVDRATLAKHQIAGLEQIKDERQRVANPEIPNLSFDQKPFYFQAVAQYKTKPVKMDVEWTP